jgi:hypothetical protein
MVGGALIPRPTVNQRTDRVVQEDSTSPALNHGNSGGVSLDQLQRSCCPKAAKVAMRMTEPKGEDWDGIEVGKGTEEQEE